MYFKVDEGLTTMAAVITGLSVMTFTLWLWKRSTTTTSQPPPQSITSASSPRKVGVSSNQHTLSNTVFIAVVGGPAVGKGTALEAIEKRYECLHISAGVMLRGAKKTGMHTVHISLNKPHCTAY